MAFDPALAAAPAPDPDPAAVSAFISLMTAVEVLSLELNSVRHEASDETSARLAAAGDELAAIQDEMYRQQQEIEFLLGEAEISRAIIMRRFLASLPLATVLTSASGRILEANAAARTVLRVPRGPLPGKPIFAFIVQDDRSRLRQALTRAGAVDELVQTTAMLAPRTGVVAASSHLALAREPSPEPATRLGETSPSVRWIILPDYESAERTPSHQQLEALTRLCQLRVDADSDLRSMLNRVARLCLQAVSNADDVSLVLGSPLQPTLTLTSSATAQHLDGVQHLRAAGPVLDAYQSHRPVALSAESVAEHPGLRDDAQAATVTSLLAIPLIIDGLAIGVLTLYARGSQRLATMMTLREAMPFVEAAQTLIRDTQSRAEMMHTQAQLETALTSRAVIDQAKGMLMAFLTCDADEAFEHLTRLSSSRHEKLRTVAQSMVDNLGVPKPSADPQL